jgi:cytochrome c biogenesis protein CcmG, thiol:disulfide interchange protein DsbE
MPRRWGLVLIPVIAVAAVAYYWLFQRPSSVPVLGRPAPSFQLQALNGAPTSLADYRGKPVIVNFWATWCEPCKAEMPALQAETAAHPDLVVLGVDNVESDVKVKTYVDQLGVSFPILLDQDGSIMERYQVTALPTSFFVDRGGVLRSIYRGPLSPDTLRDSVAAISG